MKKASSVLIGAFLLVGCRTTPNGSHCANMVWDPLSIDMGKTICETGKLCNDSTGQCEIPSLSTKLPTLIGDSDVTLAVPGLKDVSKVEVLGMLIPFSKMDATGETPPQISLEASALGSLPVCGPIDVVLVKSDGDRIVLRDAIAKKFTTWKYSQFYSDVSNVPAKSLNFGFTNRNGFFKGIPYLTYIDGDRKFGFSAMRGLVVNSSGTPELNLTTNNSLGTQLEDYVIGNFSTTIDKLHIVFLSPRAPSQYIFFSHNKELTTVDSFINSSFDAMQFTKSLVDSGIARVVGIAGSQIEIPVVLLKKELSADSYIEYFQSPNWAPAVKVPGVLFTHLSFPDEVQSVSGNSRVLGGGITDDSIFTLSPYPPSAQATMAKQAIGQGMFAMSIASTVKDTFIRHYVLVKNGSEKEIKYYDGNGVGPLSESSGPRVDQNAESIELRDVNCDGRPDVIVKSPSRIFAYLVNSRNQLEAEPKLLYDGPAFRKSSMWNSQDRAPYQVLGVQSTDGTLQLFKQQ